MKKSVVYSDKINLTRSTVNV